MERTIIVLANSRKMTNRCIAGIDVSTKEWIRPCYESGESGIPWTVRQINGEEPQLLDIIKISVKKVGPHSAI